MKKILGVILLSVLACALFVGCSGGSTVSPAWADKEVLVYTVVDNVSEETVGSMTVTNVRRPEDKTLGGKTYAAADGKTTVEIVVGDRRVDITFLTKQYNVLAEEKKVESEEENYVLNAYHSGKYAYYSRDGGKESKINVGNSGYTDGEYLYNYIRSYALPASLPSSVKIADYSSGVSKTVTTTAYKTGELLAVPFPSGEKLVSCTEVAIAVSDTPQGKPAYVWFTDDSSESRVTGRSISPSKKFPVKIIENNLTYKLKSISVG